jgi:hypothetical protein
MDWRSESDSNPPYPPLCSPHPLPGPESSETQHSLRPRHWEVCSWAILQHPLARRIRQDCPKKAELRWHRAPLNEYWAATSSSGPRNRSELPGQSRRPQQRGDLGRLLALDRPHLAVARRRDQPSGIKAAAVAAESLRSVHLAMGSCSHRPQRRPADRQQHALEGSPPRTERRPRARRCLATARPMRVCHRIPRRTTDQHGIRAPPPPRLLAWFSHFRRI